IFGAKHANFADIQFAHLPLDSTFQVIMGTAKPELIWRIICDYLLAMFDAYLKSKTPSRLLDGSENPYSQVVLGQFFKRAKLTLFQNYDLIFSPVLLT
ncbi:MAG: hypothetical protein M3247_08265, partial [Thermoproteota archaeon]|nr:hypothetical protein [Thermoproteota archaeon]